jgi:hypothetical protein
VPAAIDIAKAVLPSSRMTFAVEDMRHITKNDSAYDIIFVPGAICYLPTIDDVTVAVKEFARLLGVGGGMCLSMIASDVSDMGSCKTRIPKTFWTENFIISKYLQVLKIEDMDVWHLPHSFGRYSVCLLKV